MLQCCKNNYICNIKTDSLRYTMIIYKPTDVTPEVISRLHKGLYFAIKLNGDKTAYSDFVLKAYVERLEDIQQVLVPIPIRKEEQDKIFQDIAYGILKTDATTAETFLNQLKEKYLIIER